MRVFAAVPLILMICLPFVAYGAEQATNDTAILSEVLRNPNTNGNFTVVASMTTLARLGENGMEEHRMYTKSVRKHLIKAYGERVDELFVALIEKNKEPVRLTLPSSPKEGYLTDSDGTFEKYFEDGGGGWVRFYRENPKAQGRTRVSLPAYDPETQLVLVYKGTQSHWLSGHGFLFVYKYQNGKLEELERILLWRS